MSASFSLVRQLDEIDGLEPSIRATLLLSGQGNLERALARGTITWYDLVALVNYSTPGSAIGRVMVGHGYSESEYLLQTVVDLLRDNPAAVASMMNGKNPPRSKPSPRPQGRTQKAHRMSEDDKNFIRRITQGVNGH